jgi:hypothetical protein
LESPYCYYSFEPFNPANPDPSLRSFVRCFNCQRSYHEKYWNEIKKCLYCQGTIAQPLHDVQVPGRTPPESKRPVLPAPSRKIWYGPWFLNPSRLWLMAGMLGLVMVAIVITTMTVKAHQNEIRFEATRGAATQLVLNMIQTQTVAARPTNTPNPTPTATFTPTDVPPATPTPETVSASNPEATRIPPCPGGRPISVEKGDTVRVKNIVKELYMRSNPETGQNVQWYAYRGDLLIITSGKECFNGVAYFHAYIIKTPNHKGWINETDSDTGEYVIEVVP